MSSRAEARRAKRDLSGSHDPVRHIERFINDLVNGNLSPVAGRAVRIAVIKWQSAFRHITGKLESTRRTNLGLPRAFRGLVPPPQGPSVSWPAHSGYPRADM